MIKPVIVSILAAVQSYTLYIFTQNLRRDSAPRPFGDFTVCTAPAICRSGCSQERVQQPSAAIQSIFCGTQKPWAGQKLLPGRLPKTIPAGGRHKAVCSRETTAARRWDL